MRSGGSTERGLRPLHMLAVLFKNYLSVSKGNKFYHREITEHEYKDVKVYGRGIFQSASGEQQEHCVAWSSVRVRSAWMKLLSTSDC